MAIIVRCKRGAGDREAEPISSGLISTETMAAARGKRFLDDPAQGGYYTVLVRGLQVPHKAANVKPGQFVKIKSWRYDIDQTVRVRSARLSGTPDSVWANIETEEYCV